VMDRLVLGTAQFGLNYGANKTRIPESECFEILDYALSVGITKLDTAQDYGCAEEVIGKYTHRDKFKIISKSARGDRYEDSITTLRTKPYAYLVHDLPRYMERAAKLDFTGKIGFSIYHLHELDYLLEKKIEFDILQFPYNMFDYKFALYLNELKKQNKELYARSIFLNGRVFKDHEHTEKVMSSCLYFALKEKRINYVVVGVDSLGQLKQIVKAAEEICKTF
jgi:aryl-alcohol dehydrogenase-like predicted oxidoreductase